MVFCFLVIVLKLFNENRGQHLFSFSSLVSLENA